MILERLKEYIDYKKIAISVFERSIGMSNASFGKSLKNGGAIGTDKLENILKIYKDINLTWLFSGKGPMLLNLSVENSNLVDEPVLKYGKCQQCEDKERLIKEKEERIQELKETIIILKENCKGKQRSA